MTRPSHSENKFEEIVSLLPPRLKRGSQALEDETRELSMGMDSLDRKALTKEFNLIGIKSTIFLSEEGSSVANKQGDSASCSAVKYVAVTVNENNEKKLLNMRIEEKQKIYKACVKDLLNTDLTYAALEKLKDDHSINGLKRYLQSVREEIIPRPK